jgi:hypothetical protein
LKTPDGLEYTGSWYNGEKHGSGILKSPNGTVFEGFFVNNV